MCEGQNFVLHFVIWSKETEVNHGKGITSRNEGRITEYKKFYNAKECRASKLVDIGMPQGVVKPWKNNKQEGRLTPICGIQTPM
jgi:hypothetical protein